MLNRTPFAKVARAPGRPSGFSLVEMLIALTVGLVVVSGVIGIYVSTLKSNADNLKMLHLNQELRVAMAMMVRDIRRAGFRGDGTAAPVTTNQATSNPFAWRGSPDNLTVNVANDCITFTYDKTALDNPPTFVGAVDNDDKFGYHRAVVGGVGVIRARNGGTDATNSCSPSSVQSITDGSSVNISGLLFTITSQPVTVIGVTGVERLIRSVTITVTGNLISDPGVVRTMTETVRVQNDAFGLN